MRANPATAILCFPYMEPATCRAVVDGLTGGDWKPGGIARPGGADEVDEDAIRRCHLSRELDPELLAELDSDLRAINERFYEFAIDGFSPIDPVTVMRYGPDDHFDWHIDNGIESAPFGSRKLSFSIQLADPADYEGGDLEFALYAGDYGGDTHDAQRAAARALGAIIVFPSFHLHRVKPVTRGTRYAIVGWLHGPPFR